MIREETGGSEEGTSTARRWSSSPPCPFSLAWPDGAPCPAVSARFYYSVVALPPLANWKPTLGPLYLLFLPYVTCRCSIADLGICVHTSYTVHTCPICFTNVHIYISMCSHLSPVFYGYIAKYISFIMSIFMENSN
jgi:hypothetical protein